MPPSSAQANVLAASRIDCVLSGSGTDLVLFRRASGLSRGNAPSVSHRKSVHTAEAEQSLMSLEVTVPGTSPGTLLRTFEKEGETRVRSDVRSDIRSDVRSDVWSDNRI